MVDASRGPAFEDPVRHAEICCPWQAQIALGNGGFPVLINALEKERDDLELVRGVLECLAIAVQPRERGSHCQVCAILEPTLMLMQWQQSKHHEIVHA